VRSVLESEEDSDEELEEAGESDTSNPPSGLEMKPAWHPNQWHTRLHR
jgi:hypothetical protein